MNIILALIIFCIVLFFYLHIYFHLKTSNDLEVYEIERPSKDKLEEICDLRQPVVFDFQNERILSDLPLDIVSENYGAFDVKVRDIKEHPSSQEENELYVPLTLKASLHAFSNDDESKYLSANNQDFLEETGLIKIYKYNDAFLRPYLVSNCNYDYMFSSDKVQTPFQYLLNYRNYFMVTQGKATLKLAPPKSARYLYTIKDYENFEFRSPVNPWNVQHEYKPDFDKMKCLEVTIEPGQILYLPAYWWYSIELDEHTSISTFFYKTYMNNIAIMPQLLMQLLQNSNVKRITIKKLDNTPSSSSTTNNDAPQQPQPQPQPLDENTAATATVTANID